MKKTISISIKGFHFIIEEDAYALLSEYFQKLDDLLSNIQGKTEIIEDIELRIAELCQQKRTDKQEVIHLQDIESILATLGNPDDYLAHETFASTQSTTADKTSTNRSEKRLFRDPENSILAGVCGGIAAYFGIDVVIVRAIFVAVFLTIGFGFPLYIILWIIVPKAETSIDKLRMHGKPVTVESVKQEVEDAANRIKNNTKKWYQRANGNASSSNRLSRIAKIFLTIIGWILLVIGISFFIPVVIILFHFDFSIPVNFNGQNIPLNELIPLLFEQGRDAYLVYAATIFILLAIMTFFLVAGSSLLWKIKRSVLKVIGIISLILFLTSITMYISVGLNTEPAFENEIHQERKAHMYTGDTLYITTVGDFTNNNHSTYTIDDEDKHFSLAKDYVRVHGIEINFETSADSTFHIIHKATAMGRTSKESFNRVENIQYTSTLQSNKLTVPSSYSYPKKDKFRGQDLKVILKIPSNAIVYMNGQQLTIYGTKKINMKEDYISGGNIEPSGKFIEW